MTAPKLRNAYKVGSPVNLPIDFREDSDFCRINLYVWTGDFDAVPDVDEYQPTFSLEIKKLSSQRYDHCDVSRLIKPFIKPRFSLDDNYTFQNFFAFFMHSYDYYNNGVYVRSTPISDVQLATLGYSFFRNHYNGTIETDAPMLADGTKNDAFTLNNSASLKYKKPLQGSPANIYYSENDINQTVSDSVNNGSICSFLDDVGNIGVCNPNAYQILFLDKNGLIDFMTITGKVVEGVEYNRDNYNRRMRSTYSSVSKTSSNNSEGERYYVLNTGKLDAVMSNKVEELLLSEYIILYSHKTRTFNEVYITDSDIRLRSTLNDKSNITYNIKLKESFKMKL